MLSAGFLDFVKVCAISTRIEGKTQVIWVIVGLLEEKITSQNSLPEGMSIEDMTVPVSL